MSGRVNRDDIDKFHDYGLYIPTRTIYMGSEEYSLDDGESGVDGKMIERAVKNLHLLDAASDSPITILLNSPGGDCHYGLGLFDAIKACRSHVTIKISGIAMSMGSIILQAGDVRLISANSRVMIHHSTWHVNDKVGTAKNWVKEGEKFDSWMEQLFLEKIRLKHPGFTLKKIQEMLNFDTILNASETVALGLTDGIIGEELDAKT